MAVDQDANEAGAAPSAHADGQGAESPPDVVDFDALNAALGALPPSPSASTPQLADSEGRSSATYASAHPHAIPATRAPAAKNEPAVIVAAEETVPSGPPQMTMPMTPAGGIPAARSAPGPAAPAYGTGTEPYAAPVHAVDNGNAGRTMPLADPQRPRRPRTPTVVVRPRGPSRAKKIFVFIGLLVVFVVGGTALLALRAPESLGLGTAAKPPPPPITPTVSASPAVATPAITATSTASSTPSVSSAPSAALSSATSSASPAPSPAASVVRKPRPPKPAPTPSPSAAVPQ